LAQKLRISTFFSEGRVDQVMVSVILLVIYAARGASPDGPNQQCGDDAGPPWEDDGPIAYYEGFPNAPVLPSGECPAPLSAACAGKGALAAHMDGPVDCGGKGWFCRIFDQPDHRMPGVSGGRFPDSNFASCNQSETDHDLDGHCHGSDVDDTYGWWIRDHWHRNYAGKLKCCCDWQATVGVVNRCDYRKHVTPEVRLTCRDANEEHNVDWGPGCTKDHFQNYKEPPAGTCWEVASFGPGPFEEPPMTPSPSPSPISPSPTPLPSSPSPSPSPSACQDGEIRSEASGVCVEKPWDDFEGCAKEAALGVCEEADAWISEHCCVSCGSCTATSSWSQVDGGMNRVCRGKSRDDNSPTYYMVPSGVFSLAACKAKCEETPGCKGIEHKPSGRCEVWTRAEGIGASKAATGFTCLRFGSSTTTATTTLQGSFKPVDGGSSRACRGADPQDNSASYYTVHSGIRSLEDCKMMCSRTASCCGIEHSEGQRRCEVWTRPEGIQASRPLNGFSCHRFEATGATHPTDAAVHSQAIHRSRRHAFLGTAFLQAGHHSTRTWQESEL